MRFASHEVPLHQPVIQQLQQHHQQQQEQSIVVWHAGETKPLPLKAPLDAFCPGSVDSFTVTAPWLGTLNHITLSHNGKGANPDWLLESVRIVHMQSKQEWLFFGHVWLHGGNGNQVPLTPGKLMQGLM